MPDVAAAPHSCDVFVMSDKAAVLFPCDPLSPRSPDPAFAPEAEIARACGFDVSLIDHDELDVRTDAAAALRKCVLAPGTTAVYRGWMIAADGYAALFDDLARRDVRMITDPSRYEACHHAPGGHAALSEWMPETVFVPPEEARDMDAVFRRLEAFDGAPLVLKDWVKSQASGYWLEACYVPDSSSMDEVARVVGRFLDLQGPTLCGGLVFKRHMPLASHGGVPLEHRAFAVDGRIVGSWPRSREAAALPSPPDDLLQAVASRAPSPFASLDFALEENGRWWLLEAGDGQVSGLPDAAAALPMFEALRMLAARGRVL